MGIKPLDNTTVSNLDFSLGKEVVRHNITGALFSSTIALCNTRSWHGILSIFDQEKEKNKVILSTLDDSVMAGGNTYFLSVRKYPDVYFPLGHQYIEAANYNPYCTIDYRIGDIAILRKEMVLAQNEPTLLIRYTLLSSSMPIKLKIRPIVAFRLADQLIRRSNDFATGNTPIDNGIAYCPNENETPLYMQANCPNEFITAPDWNYNIEYPADHSDGKPYQEDLFMPGFFELQMVSSQEIIFSASMKPQQTKNLADFFRTEAKALPRRISYAGSLQYAASQMFRLDREGYHVIEKMPPSSFKSKDVCGALAGLTLPNNNEDMFCKVARSYFDIGHKVVKGEKSHIFYAPETPLWFVWAIQQYTYKRGDRNEAFKDLLSYVDYVVNGIMENSLRGLTVDRNGLLATVKDKKLVYNVEINAMWYNSLMFFAELNNTRLPEQAVQVERFARKMKNEFLAQFTDKANGTAYFANSVDTDGNKDFTLSPRVLLAYALPYTLADKPMTKLMLPIVEEKLLTPVGLRTIAADDPKYDTEGSITSFYLGFLVEIYLRILGEEGIEKAEKLYRTFDSNLNEVIPPCFYEEYTPKPPYVGKGSPMSAVTIATINRIRQLIDQF